MRKQFAQKTDFIKLIFLLTVIVGLKSAAFGATFTVTKTADTNDGTCDTDCSLREAVAAAGAIPSDDVINFSAAIFNTPQIITLTGGELVLQSGALTINGTGANLLTVSGNNRSRVFFVAQNTNAVINNLTVTGGNGTGQLFSGNGGAVAVNGGATSLTLNNSVVSGNSATDSGGGIYSNSGLTLNNSTITGNTAGTFGGGGIYQYAVGIININNSIISLNRDLGFYGGGGIYINPNSSITLTDSLLDRNQSSTGGGGIYTQTSINLLRTRLNENTAPVGGGFYAIDGSSGTANNGGVVVTLTDSILSGNKAGSGGGGYAVYFVFPFPSVRVNLTGCTISGNQATNTDGGGFNVFRGTLTATNTTFSDNSAARNGGALFTSGATEAIVNLTNATVSNNSATAGGGFFVTNPTGATTSTVSLRNTIVANNSATNGPDIVGVINSQGYLLIGNTINATLIGSQTGLILNVNPRLGPLVNNGGSTPTRALLAGSPAIDTGDPNNQTVTDQRGVTRPKDGNNDGISLPDIGAFERSITLGTPFDFDGDGRAEIAVFRPSNGNWYSLNITNSNFSSAQLGASTDRLAPADYDGDGKTDIAVFREAAFGNFYILQSRTNTVRTEQFGTTGDLPVPGDWDADGRADLAVYRNGAVAGAQSNFYYRPSGTPGADFRAISWGASGDKPAVGDFDGDGRQDAAVFRPSNGIWYVLLSTDNRLFAVQFGAPTDLPVAADYDADGRTDVAVWRPSNGTWYLNRSTEGFAGIQFGQASDVPVPADYDGDGRAEAAVFRPSNGYWYLNRSTAGFVGIGFGASTDQPVPSAFVR